VKEGESMLLLGSFPKFTFHFHGSWNTEAVNVKGNCGLRYLPSSISISR